MRGVCGVVYIAIGRERKEGGQRGGGGIATGITTKMKRRADCSFNLAMHTGVKFGAREDPQRRREKPESKEIMSQATQAIVRCVPRTFLAFPFRFVSSFSTSRDGKGDRERRGEWGQHRRPTVSSPPSNPHPLNTWLYLYLSPRPVAGAPADSN